MPSNAFNRDAKSLQTVWVWLFVFVCSCVCVCVRFSNNGATFVFLRAAPMTQEGEEVKKEKP